MKTVSWVPVLMAGLAAGVWMAGLPAGDEMVESRPAKSGRNLPRYGMPSETTSRAKTNEQPAVPGTIASTHTTASLAAWAERNPDAAVEWAMALEGKARNTALGVVVVEVAGYSPTLAIRCAEGISDPQQRGEMLGFALAQQAANDASVAFDWLAKDGSEEKVRSLIECSVLPALAEVDPPRIARLLAEGNVTPRAVDAVLAATVQRWTQQDAHAAAAWVMEFDDGRMMKAAMPSLIGLWTKQEREAPATWIESLAKGPARDEACAAYAVALAIIAPEEAEAWAERIGEKELLAETMRRIGADLPN
jgi:uncharacterized protein YbaA (DUF1428 family)